MFDVSNKSGGKKKQKNPNTNLLDFFFPLQLAIFISVFSKPDDSKSGLYIFVLFFSPRMISEPQWASFMLLYGLHGLVYK